MTTWTTACQASLSITNSQSLLKLISIESVMPSNHLILYHPLLLLPSIFPSIRVFSNESALCNSVNILEDNLGENPNNHEYGECLSIYLFGSASKLEGSLFPDRG